QAQQDTFTDIYDIKISPIKCSPTSNCPTQLIRPINGNEVSIYDHLGERCAESYEDFLSDPISSHYWIEDPEITEQGKADERARQFLYWVLSTNAVDQA